MRVNCCFARIGIASITVGNNSDPNLNQICMANIDRDGIFTCTTPLTGMYIGLTRNDVYNSPDNAWHFAEIRAYTWVPFDVLANILSADVMPNSSLLNSIRINESESIWYSGGGI
jgi:hypothetical protein